MAHGFLQSFDNKLDVFSAGTKPAEKVHPMAVKVMDEMGIDLAHHIPKSVNLYIAQEWDYETSAKPYPILYYSCF